MKLLIITDNNVWGGSEILWRELHHRPGLDSQVWCPHGNDWLPADIRRLPPPSRTWKEILHRRPADHRLPIGLEADTVLYVICAWVEPLLGTMLAQVETLLSQNISVTILVQAVNESAWPCDAVRVRLLKLASRVRWAFVSQSNKDHVVAQLPKLKNAALIYNLPFKPLYASPLDTESPWAFVGRLHVESKGLDLLLRASVNFPIRIDLYGDGPNARALADHARDIGANVEFKGHFPDVSAIWATHSVLVLCSRLEGMPLSLIEAGMCGRPAMVTQAGGSKEIVAPDGGIVVEPTVAAIRGGMDAMLIAKPRWQEMGEHLRSRCEKLCATDPVAQLLDLLGSPLPPTAE